MEIYFFNLDKKNVILRLKGSNKCFEYQEMNMCECLKGEMMENLC